MEEFLPAQPFTVERKYRHECAESEGQEQHRTTTAFAVRIPRGFFWVNVVFIILVLGVAVRSYVSSAG